MKVSKIAVVSLMAALTVSFASTQAHAFGSAPSAPSAPSNGNSGGSGGTTPPPADTVQQNLSAIEQIALNVAVIYAETDPHYAPILNALGIHTAQDVQNLIGSMSSGKSFESVVSYLVFNYGQSNPQISSVLGQLGIHSYADIQAVLADPSAVANQNTLFNLAFQYASQNPKFGPWLATLQVHSGADLAKIFTQGGFKTNLQDQLISIGLAYLISHVHAQGTAQQLIPVLVLGVYQGLTQEDVSAITQLLVTSHK